MKRSKLFFKWSLLTTSLLFLLFITTSNLTAQTISLTSGTYSQDFNTLVNTGTSTAVPTGWLFTEAGTNANTTYTAGTGSGNTGDSYSFGPASNTDRTLGGLQSGSLVPTIGAGFTNNSGNTINSITISYTGEQWRLGVLSRPDRLDFQYSTDATSLTTGTWISETNLNFTAPVTGPTVGAINGNDAGARTIISYTISGLNIANGAALYIRWNDFNATSSDDGLGVDDFSLSFTTLTAPPAISCPSNIQVNAAAGSCGAIVTFSDAVATGSITAVTQTCGLTSGSFFPVGVTTICYEVTGVPSVNCSFTVTVNDVTPPNAVCQNATVVLDASGNGTLSVAQINNGSSDNCSIATMTVSPNTFTCSNIGTPVTVTLTVTDVNGNFASCNASVTVIDNLPPTALCQNATVILDASGNGTVTTAQINNGSTDNCGIAGMTVSPSTFNCSNISGGTSPTDLFISEYIEGSSNNKCIEIYNGTNAAVNLAAGGYALKYYFNGSITAGLTIPLTGTVASGDVYVVCQSLSAAAFLAQADQTNSSGWYNGDDAIELVKAGPVTVDLVGSIGTDPGSEWGSGLVSTADNTIRRKPSITAGVTSNPGTYPGLALEWDGYAIDVATGLGAHTISVGTPVTLTVTDVNGLVSTCTSNVTVVDNLPPTAICQNATVVLDASGNGTLSAAQINNGSSDNCSIATMTVNPNTFTCANVGSPVTVTLTVTDVNGNVASCTSTVTVVDNLPPTALCQNATVYLDASGNGTLAASAINNGSSDNCAIASTTVSPNTFNCSTLTGGATPTDLFISEYIEGSSNNKCIEIFNGTGAPVNLSTGGYQLKYYFNGSVSAGLTISLTGTIATGDVYVVCNSGSAAAFLAQADLTNGSGWYNGDDAIVLVKNSGATVLDIFGRIGEDPGSAWGVSPLITADKTLRRNASVISGISVNPAAGFPSLSSEWASFLIDDATGLGSHAIAGGSGSATIPVILTVTDVNGLSSTCSATVTVLDTVSPNVVVQNISVALNASGSAIITASQIDNGSTDACGISGYTISPSAFNCSNLGSNTVTLTVTDVNGNTSSANATVTVIDNLAPAVNCQNVTLVLDSNGNGSVTAAQVDNGSSDNCNVASVVVSANAFDCSDVGSGIIPTDLIISEYIEGSSFNKCIEIFNGTGSSIDLTANGYQLRIYFNGSASSTNINLTGVIAPGQVHVVCNSTAAAGFISQADQTTGSLSFNGDDAIALYNGTLAQEIDIFGRIGEDPGAGWIAGAIQTNDRTVRRLSSVLNGVTVNPPAGFPSLGTEWNVYPIDDLAGLGSHSINAVGNVVTLTVTDGSGNSSSCLAAVTVVDATPPNVICQPLIIQLDATGNATISALQLDNGSTDACGGLTFSASKTSFDCSNTGVNTVVLTVTDANGNSAACTTTVTVQDIITPVIICPGNISVQNDAGLCGAVVTYTVPAGTDNCTASTIQLNGLISGSVFPVGTTVNTYKVTDASGNIATCSFSISVSDLEFPVITSALPDTIYSCNPVSWTPPAVSDNCQGVQTSSTHSPGTNFGPGTTMVTYTATDAYSNASTYSFYVTRLEESTAATGISTNRDYNNICQGDNITLTINGGHLGEGAMWKWYTGTCGGAALPAFNGMTSITVAPAVTTTYFARAEGLCNTTACASVQVIVSTGNPGNVTITSVPAIGAVGQTGVVTCTAATGATFYRWTSILGHINAIWFNGAPGPVETTTNSVNVAFQLPQSNYQIRVVAGNACGRSNNASAHIRGTVPAPNCLVGPVLACPNTTATYSVATCPIPGTNGYQWTVTGAGASIASGQGTATITVNFVTGFTNATVCVSGVSTFGLAGPTTCLNVSNSTEAPGAITGNAAPCISSLETYTISPVTGAGSYIWSTNIVGATATGTTVNGSVQFPSGAFSGQVCVAAVSTCGTSVATCFNVTSGAAGIPGSISGPVSGICDVTANYSLATNDANSYNWILPAGVSFASPNGSNSVDLTFAAGLTGPQTITVEAFYDCGSATSSIVVDGKPEIPTVTPSVFCLGTIEQLFASSPGNDITYSWIFTGVADTFPLTPNNSNYYVEWLPAGGTVSVTATNSCGTSAPFNGVAVSCVRIGDNTDTKVYPNPTDGNLTIEFNSYAGGNFNMTITDMAGRVILTTDVKAAAGLNRQTIDLGFVNPGVYVLYMNEASGDISVHKVTVE